MRRGLPGVSRPPIVVKHNHMEGMTVQPPLTTPTACTRERRPHPAGRLCAGALVLLTLLSGCSILNPHVSPRVARPTPTTVQDGTVVAVTLPAAIDYANGVRDAYHCAVGEQSMFRNGLAITAVSMAGAALGLGITGGATEVITALGVGGASAFGLGTLLYSDARQRVYLAGSEAVGCAISAMTPLMISETKLKTFGTALGVLERRAGELQRQIEVVEAAEPSMKDDALKKRAGAALSQGRAIAGDAAQMVGKGYLLLNRVESAAVALVTAVDTIRDKVGAQITRTEPDLASITAVIGGLGAATSRFAPTPPPTPAADEKALHAALDAGALSAEGEVQKLERLVAQVAGDMAEVAPLIGSVEAATREAGTLAGCTVAEVDLAFSVTPNVSSIDIKPGETIQFATKGGSGAPRVAFVGNKVDGLTADVPLGASSVLLVADAKVKVDSKAILVITDGTGKQQKEIAVNVKK